jgi:hypothetical protein
VPFASHARQGDVPLVNSVEKNHCAGVALLFAAGAKVHNPSCLVNTPVMVRKK